ncbi:MAG: GNAT family N-acetyltransferase [Eubacteriaceae bacterium]|nr:GNAT family N-acetyltransferase [Eubacteriaceae bacterium]
MVYTADIENLSALTEMAAKLWPQSDMASLREEMKEYLTDEERAVFLSLKEGRAVGFALCSLRREYTEGAQNYPVGYLEGIYIEEEFRGKRRGSELLKSCEQWAKQCGCLQFASDCELENTLSLAFHLKNGFEEANRIICFIKKL